MKELNELLAKVEEDYEASLVERFPCPKRRSLVRLFDKMIQAQRLYLLIWGKPMTEELLLRWVQDDYDVMSGAC